MSIKYRPEIYQDGKPRKENKSPRGKLRGGLILLFFSK